MQKDLTIELVNFNAEVQAIRVAVFQQEQGVAAALEFDGQDAQMVHLLACWQGQPVGTARILYCDATTAKLQRVAVVSAYRSRGIGQAMMQFALEHLQQQGVNLIKIHAQQLVVPFYENLGFTITSDRFQEAGIPHVKMQRRL
ncbi:GNAT family N-acetyltransferase [filamentous cyanobacterium LEGE 11480]|uniref:GNAT family N-acetyltransferase n=1 Tax=Romeriopsis navalis LEGE 11480 TaxID=2777977 RepID=A0A928Z5E6_9CYAN|nr:GNAT family N-acetyltransferase [Romeriopsis navalis]MBE9031190.1 GNAT family N-acetyltransferase [Romeriopsis navalis LEGE 11480]